MAGSDYGEAKWVVAPVAMSLWLLFYSQLFINVEFYYEEKGSLVFASLGSLFVNIILNWLLIPKYGFIVAGYTTWISYILFAYCNYCAMKKIFMKKNVNDDLYDYKTLILIIVLFTILSFVGVILYEIILLRVIAVLIVSSILLINAKRIIEQYKKYRKR